MEGSGYQAGLDRIQEAVVSSHFMEHFANNAELELYDDDQFATKSLEIDAGVVYDQLVPSIVSACEAFAGDRAAAAASRARENHRRYGLDDPRKVGVAQIITEVMFDRQYRNGPAGDGSRRLLCEKVRERVEAGSPIEMVIPALPFKFSSPLKTRGRRPDLAELNFILGLYEIVLTVELIYQRARPSPGRRLAGFTVVSDGSRFNRLINEPDSTVVVYQRRLLRWIEQLRLERHITVLDYRALLRNAMPEAARKRKSAVIGEALREYTDILWPIFDPCDAPSAMDAAARFEPDPEYHKILLHTTPILGNPW